MKWVCKNTLKGKKCQKCTGGRSKTQLNVDAGNAWLNVVVAKPFVAGAQVIDEWYIFDLCL